MNILVVFDDTNKKSEAIRDVIGDKGFSDVIVKKHHLEEYYQRNVLSLYPDCKWKLVNSSYEFQDLLEKLPDDENLKILHCFAHYIFTDREKALQSFAKLKFTEMAYQGLINDNPAFLIFGREKEYRAFLKAVCTGISSYVAARSIANTFPVEGMTDIGQFENFIQCITGSFDSRYFNSVNGNAYTLKKTSTDKKKIKAEYTFYRLLPDDMKRWFVMPYQYEESDKTASYMMERLHITDLAIKWVHGSIDNNEFSQILDDYFRFFNGRHPKKVSKEEYQRISENLYTFKVKNRIEQLKQTEVYPRIESLLEVNCQDTIDNIVKRYFALKEKLESSIRFQMVSVIGHGDPCFSNTLYSKTTQFLKFIDPKGALVEAELWTNPYYDIAKLSHSICGLYDFFNNGLFEIHIDEDLHCRLIIDFDNKKYVKIFQKKVEENGYNYLAVRLYEASLFLSMLPLHIDNPFKVFGFILNACKILKEIEHEI